MTVELGPAAGDLEQGDVFEMVPSVYVRSLAYMARLAENHYALRHQLPAGTDVGVGRQANVREVVLDLEAGERDLPPDEGEDRIGNAFGARRLGLVLTHGCEIDKMTENPMVTVAQVRELSGVHDDDRDSIRTYEQKRAFYLPPSEHLRDEHYADFRFLTTIRCNQVEQLGKLASMNEDGRRLLHFQLFRFFARKLLPPGWETWADEAEE